MSETLLSGFDIRWEFFREHRVAIWPKESQPEIEALNVIVTDPAVQRANAISNESRRREWLATRALSQLLTAQEPMSGALGEPIWRDGWKGSITHKNGHVAIMTVRSPLTTYGVDLEFARDLNEGVISRIMNVAERDLCRAAIFEFGSSFVFAAKEAIYKALFPIVQKRFYFEAVEMIDVISVGQEIDAVFKVCDDLCDRVRAGMLVRCRARKIRITGSDYWLAVAFSSVY